MLTLIILIGAKYHQFINWRLQVTELTNLLYIYYIKLKSRLSVRPSDRHADISAVSAIIEMGLARNES